MKERVKFIGMYLQEEWTMAELCRHFEISRKTGYKMVKRFRRSGWSGLEDRSRAPHHHPNAVSELVECGVVAARQAHPRWGPKKLKVWLQRREPDIQWPAVSTIGEILSCHGLTVPRRRSRKVRAYDQPFVGCDFPNAVWSADLKGWFLTGDGVRCDPLTISDNYSRYLLRCQAVSPANHYTIQPLFEVAFREYGLPLAIRTDNGAPFATTTLGALSKLSIWWLKLGIIPERIEPGEPQQNGRHERMHRTLKDETASPPKRTWRRQQKAFDHFRQEYNQERPHESLNQKTPASLYVPSERPYPLVLPEMTYPDDMVVRFVKSQGDISWKNRHVYLSVTLARERVGLRQVSDQLFDIYFGPIKLATLDTHQYRLIHLPRTKKERNNDDKKEPESKKVLPMCPV
jgi:transposase InsO family protein